MSARPRRPRASLDGLFRPRSIAVIGASRRPGAIGRQVVANLVTGGFTGPVYPVNPHTDTVLSVPCHRSVGAIPGPVDLAVVVVPANDVARVAEECGRKGVKGMVVVTAGFREIGGVGIEREERLKRITRRYGIRVIGPNCMGVIHSSPETAMNASFSATLPRHGQVAMLSQSGALGEAILADAAGAGLGVAMFASIGNVVDVEPADLIEYWEDDPQVQVILLYMESFGEATRFAEVARRVSRKKPILAVKAGRSAAGAAAAGSHTGSVGGADVAADTLLRQCGVLRLESFRDMFSLAAALLHQPLPRGRRVAVVTNAGGPGILATDAVVALGLEMASFTAATKARLRKVLPVEASVANPVDLIASADARRYRDALRLVVADPGVDALLVLFVSPIMIDAVAVAEAIVSQVKDKGKTVLACLMGRQRGDEASELLRANGIVVYRFPEDAARTLRLLCRRAELVCRRPGRPRRFTVDRRAAARLLKVPRGSDPRGTWLLGERAEAVLAAYGIRFAECRRVRTPEAAVAAAFALGLPVVLKGESPALLHKSELRAVRTGLTSGEDVFAAARDLLARLAHLPQLRLQVQQRARGHREILLGMTRDPRYGPLFAVGLGGTMVEVLRDLSFRVAPLDEHDPAEMFAALKGAALLGPFRGDPAVDLRVAEEALLRLHQLVLDFPQIQEVEVNPFILGAKGVPSVAVDARIRVAP